MSSSRSGNEADARPSPRPDGLRPAFDDMLDRLAAATRHLLLLTDLRRTHLGLAIAWIGCRVLSPSSIVRFDGPVSVRAAWTPAELAAMARERAARNVAQIARVAESSLSLGD